MQNHSRPWLGAGPEFAISIVALVLFQGHHGSSTLHIWLMPFLVPYMAKCSWLERTILYAV